MRVQPAFRPRICVADDEEGIRYGLSRLFQRSGFETVECSTGTEVLSYVRENNLDVLLLDVRLAGELDGHEVLDRVTAIDPELAVFVITGYASIENAVDAMKKGAVDYLVKPVDNAHLLNKVVNHLERVHEDGGSGKRLAGGRPGIAEAFTSRSAEMQRVLSVVHRVQDQDISVLITGESGVGKDLLARHIHGHSPRGDNAFVAVNCAAFSESLLLSELFGHEKGAFTGAESRKLGCFERAHGGTLFLDEIGDMALDTQAKLLRVLESREFERLGGSHGVRVDVRVIAATNHDLGRLVRDGRFREDLYYRINVVRVHVPPLRERHDDIKLLVETFLEHFNRKYQRNVREIPPSAMEGLLSHPWPGNIRELKNVISQSVLLSSTGTLELFGLEPKVSWEAEPASSFHAEVTQVTAARERELVESALRQSRGNKSEAARMLGITRKTLQRKVARFELDAEEYREYLVTQRVGHQVSS